ncbi:hypothetical protein DES36_11962 [Alkalibaculum bacchi]|uniref:Uncharacterized protein n=1 Tax=Alkalibaculum bacchi TaxID=645887 RepID=A0A366HZF0_9FIRM|nr:hypothetical protein [Alkalibaculum bacchi]RBP59337.1 hypothetical protein DES36_11962 [Alkalibaculum bacchi]
MKVTEVKNPKNQGNILIDVLFSAFKSNDLPMVDIIPYKRITKEGYLVDKENAYQAFIKVKTTDLISMNMSDLNRMISQLTNLCRIYTEPIKILSMTYSTETIEQQLFWKNKINEYRKMLLSSNITNSEYERYEVMIKLATDNLRRVNWVEDSLSELTFFIVVYGKNEKEIGIHIRDLIRLGGRQFDLQQLKDKDLENILFRLNNMNTKM